MVRVITISNNNDQVGRRDFRHNETLQESSCDLQQQQQKRQSWSTKKSLYPQPYTVEIWDGPVPDNFKPPSLVLFDGKSDSHEQIITINA